VTIGVAPFGINSTASSGLTVTFASTTLSVCTVNVATVTILTPGSCSITASQAGNGTYAAATPVTQAFTVLQTQTITFAPLSTVTIGVAPFTVSATASSNLTVTFASNTLSVCTVNLATVTILTPGSCSITASQAGNGTYAAATPVTQAFTVQQTQTITFAPLSNVTFGVSPFTVSATANSNLTVTFTSTTLSVCTVNVATVTILTAGSCSITAGQAGNGTYAAGTPVTQSFTVNMGSQTITFDPILNQTFGISPFAIAAQSSAFLPISFASTTTPVCTIADDLVMLLKAGTCSITASQGGTGNYNAATAVTKRFTVSQALPTGTLTAAVNSPFAVGTSPDSVAVGDFNGDGIPDLAITNEGDNTVTVLLGNGSGGFAAAPGSPFAVGTSPIPIAVGDFNGDGIQDLAIGNVTSNNSNLTVLLGNGSGGFAAAPGSPFAVGPGPRSVAVGDFNQDGIQDLVTANLTNDTLTVLLGDGSGGFGAPLSIVVGTSPTSVAVGDFNGDGIPDLVAANFATGFGNGSLTVLFGDGRGHFTTPGSQYTVGFEPSSVAVGDFNGDGIPDLAATLYGASTVAVLLGNGSGGFSPAQTFAVGTGPYSVAVADINGDGIPDLVTANLGGDSATVLIGNGSGGFTPASGSPFAVGSGPVYVAVGDFNGDGKVDLVTANSNSNNVTVLLGALSPTSSLLSTTSPLTIVVGQSVPLSLAVSNTGTAFNTLTGPATFYDNGNALGTAGQTGSPYTFNASSLAVGSHPLTAVYGGGSGSSGSTSNIVTILAQAPQTITFAPLSTVIIGVAPFGISATASSNLAVTFTSNTLSVCTVNAATVTILSPGSCSITASQPGNVTYAAAAPATQAFTVLQTQTITFAPLSNVTFGVAPFGISATASSNLMVTFTSNTLSACAVNVATLTILTPGNCSITASQAGNGTYAAAAPVTQSFTVLNTQTITFGNLSNVIYGVAPFGIGATATSNLTVTFASNTQSVCTVNVATVTILATGVCSITASQPGNGTYAAANPVTQIFTVNPASQTITFDTIPNRIFGVSPFPIAAQSSVLLPVTFNSTTSSVCRTADDLVILLSAGTCSITASQGGDVDFTAATSVTKSFTVSQANPSGTLTAAANSPFAVGSGPTSAAVGDFNRDGIPDLAVTNVIDDTVTLLLGNGSGGFTAAPGSPFAAGTIPYSVAVGDFNGDGIQDLAIAEVGTRGSFNPGPGGVTVLLGNGSGGFTAAPGSPFATGNVPDSVAVGDFNGDGIQDLAIANGNSGNVTVLLGNGSGGFAAAPGSPFTAGTGPVSVVVEDFNGDGVQDLAVANSNSNDVTVLLGTGTGGFTAASGSPFAVGTQPNSVVAGDFNGDGIPDLAAANDMDNTVTVLLGNGSGGFTAEPGSPFTVGTNPLSVVVGDFNGDGIPDLATANAGSDNVTVLLGNSSGGFAAAPGSPFPAGTEPIPLAVADFNGDGRLDLATANQSSNNLTVLLGASASTSSLLSTTSRLSVFVGQPVPLTLNVSDTGTAFNTLTGTATFMDGGNVLGTATQTGSPYSFNASSLAVGSHPLTAVYGGGSGSAASTSNGITIQVTPPLSISFGANSISTFTGGSVSAGFSASGGTPPYTFSVAGQPAGVAIGGASLSGTPTHPGNFNAAVTVTDANLYTASAPIAINVLGLATTALPSGAVGQFYAVSIAAAGGTGPLSFAATGLPAGLSLTNYGYLNGTVATPGTYPLNISVSSGGVTAAAILNLIIAPSSALSISLVNGLVTGANGTVNVPYSQALSANGGSPPYTWSVISSAPPQGLSLNASGILSGTPTIPGVFSFGAQVVDTAGAAATATVSITIQAAPLLITTTSLPSAVGGVAYPQLQVEFSGGVPPVTWAIADGSSLPPGFSFSSAGVLTSNPNAAGTSQGTAVTAHASTGSTQTFSVGITVTDQAHTHTNTTFPLTIRPPSTDLILTSASLAFSLMTPATKPPASQVVGIQSTMPSVPLGYTLSVNPPVPWLGLANGTTTPDSIQVSITDAALTLSPGIYQTAIVATCTCSGNKQNIAVSLTVTAAPPQLRISTGLLSFATTGASLGLLSQPINVQNSGGGTLGFASISCEAPWCMAGPPASSLAGGVSAMIPVTVDPSVLSPGFYRTQVDITTSGGTGAVPVTLFISANSTLTLAPAGSLFTQPAGSAPGNPNGSFLVNVNSSTPVNFSAAIIPVAGLPVPSWLVLGTPAGSASSTQPGTVSFSIDPAAAALLAPGAYYGEIQIGSPDVSNSPKYFEVVLNVAAANSPVAPDPEPGGLLFITSVGGVLPPQTVKVYSSSASASTFQTSAATASGGGWLSVTPDTGNASATAPGITTVSVDTSRLSAGVYQGGVSYSLSATAVRTVSVTLIVTSTGGTGGAGSVSVLSPNALPRAGSCTPTLLVPAQTGLVSSFSQPAGWPTPLQIVLANDCGSTVTNGQIVATFSNGDPPLALPLANPAQGVYSGTWSPARPSSQVAIKVTASAPGFPAATSQIAGAVVPNAVPLLTPNGTLHSFDPLVGAALAPGTIVAIYGQNLAAQVSQPTSIPLPTASNGTSVIIGGMPAPLYYVSPGQVNAQVPFELAPGNQYDVIISANGALTTPQPIQLSAAAPGLAAFSDGTLIAQHSDGTLVGLTSPAKAGEYLVAYLAGLGGTTVPVTSGAASPTSPLAQPSNTPVLTIDGAQSPFLFAGLTPGLVGLYQINFQVPASLPAGDIKIVVSQNGQASNQTVLPYQP
jgi:hypothetical protein